MRSFSVLILSAVTSLSAFADSFPKDLKVLAEPRTESAATDVNSRQWLNHVGYSVIDPFFVTVTAFGETRKYQVPANTQLMSIAGDGKTALLIRPDRKLVFANLTSGELKESELPYASVLKRWEIGDNDPGRRVHLLSLHGEGEERDKALFDRRVYYGLLVDTYKENRKTEIYNMDGSLKMTCDFNGIEEQDLGPVDSRFEFVNQAGPVLTGDKTMVDFVIHNSGLSGHIDLMTTYFSVQKRDKGSKAVLSGFCK